MAVIHGYIGHGDDWRARVEANFAACGETVRWLGHNGLDIERDAARGVFAASPVVTVKHVRIGGVRSTYEFVEVPGLWNTVMFERLATPEPCAMPQNCGQNLCDCAPVTLPPDVLAALTRAYAVVREAQRDDDCFRVPRKTLDRLRGALSVLPDDIAALLETSPDDR